MPESIDTGATPLIEEPGNTPGGNTGAGFLSRWSRRKAESRAEQMTHPVPRTDEPRERGSEPAASGPASDPASGPLSTEDRPSPGTEPLANHPPALSDADMPPLDSLGPDSDYSGFLSPGVSKELRRQALARLFRGAAFNVTDGLDDYAEDFTQFTPLGDLVTAEMRHALERQARLDSETAADGDVEAALPAEGLADTAPDNRDEDDDITADAAELPSKAAVEAGAEGRNLAAPNPAPRDHHDDAEPDTDRSTDASAHRKLRRAPDAPPGAGVGGTV